MFKPWQKPVAVLMAVLMVVSPVQWPIASVFAMTLAPGVDTLGCGLGPAGGGGGKDVGQTGSAVMISVPSGGFSYPVGTAASKLPPSVFQYLPAARLPGQTGALTIEWGDVGTNAYLTAGPCVKAWVNGGTDGPVFLGNGASFIEQQDLSLPTAGMIWAHNRVYSSKGASGGTWQGEGWWCNEMMAITVSGSDGASDVDLQFDPHHKYAFTYSSGSWTCQKAYLLKLTFDGTNNEYLAALPNGQKFVFHDKDTANVGQKLKRWEDAFGKKVTFNYQSSSPYSLDYAQIEPPDTNSKRKIVYEYYSSGDNSGKLQYIKVYKSTTTSDANLIAKAEYVYHSSSSDEYGTLGDLMKTILSWKATADGDGTLSCEQTYYYRYYTASGDEHELRYVLLPENADRLGSPESKTNAQWADYVNVTYTYDSNDRVTQTEERLPGAGCGCGSGSGSLASTTYSWAVNTTDPGLDNWALQCTADRDDGSRVYCDVNSEYQILTWVVQDTATNPTQQLIWHFDYGTSGDTENRLIRVHNPSACDTYNTSTHAVTIFTNAGVIHEIDYDTSANKGYPKAIKVKNGSSPSADKLTEYSSRQSGRPDLVTQIKVYETAGQASPPTTNISYSFYDDATDKVQLKEIVITHPAPSTGKNGSGSSTVEKGYFDQRNGRLRWEKTCPGYVNYFAYDDATGRQTVHVRDVNTSSLPSIVSSTWDGAEHGGLAASSSVPYSRFESGGLNLDDLIDFDSLGRRRKVTDAEGTISFYAYMDDAARVYPAWNTSTYKTLLPTQVVETDRDGRPEKILALNTDFAENLNASNEPIGTATYTNSQIVRWTQNTYNISGMLESTDRYHAIPASGSGSRYTDFYRTVVEYDSMGRVEFVVADVANTAGSGPPQTYDTEQITEMAYDFLGRTTTTKEVVSDETNDVTSSKPTRITTAQYYYDDPDSDSTPEQGEGDGNLRWVRRWFGSGGSDYNDTEMRYDWRNRLCLTVPPAAPFTLMAYDHLDRSTATGQYSATTNLDPGDDPATTENGNRLRLSKTLYDEWDRVYRAEEYTDPGAATPASPLATDYYYDCRSLAWAVDAPNAGITFSKYDGADRLIETFQGTQFDTTKYSSGAPNYPDDNEGIVQHTTYTLSNTDEIEQVLTRELNHTDTDGMDLTGTVDYIRTYVYHWFDAAHRLTGTANYGTNNADGWKDNSSAPTYGASAPDRSDTVLVTTHTYNTAGRLTKVTDPRGLETLSTFDALDRVTQMDENDGGSPERITKYQYNGLSSMTKIIADIATDQQTEYVYAHPQNARWVTKIRYPNPSTGAPSDSAEDTITFTYNKDGTLAARTDQNGTVLTWVYDALRRKTEEEVTTLGSYTGGAGAVDGTVRALTWTYRSDGQVEFVTSHDSTTPDMTFVNGVRNQIKYEYNSAFRLDKEKLEYDGKVDGSTPYVTYNYGYSSSDNRYRLNNIIYPNSKKVWYGYTHTGTSTTFEDTINDTFSRVGQIAFDNAGSIGNIIAEYSFNGLGHLAIRNHDDASGWYGNDMKLDYHGGTSGTYAGLDRFGRVIDQKFVHYATGVPSVNQTRLQYGHDRDSNRTTIERSLSPSWSQQLTYDNLNRLTKGQFGYLESASAQLTDVAREWFMDELGNINQTGGLKINGVSETVKHATNATNEITSLTQASPAGAPAIINDPFTNDTLNGLWAVDKGAASLTSTADKLKFTSLTSSLGKVLADDPTVYGGSFSVKITPNASTGMSGVIFADDSSGSFYAVVLNRGAGTNGKIELYHYASGNWGSAVDSDAGNFSNNSTEYELRVEVRQRQVVASAWDGTTRKAYFKYNSSTLFGTGKAGIVADNTTATFDDFKFHRSTPHDPAVPGWNSSSAVTLTTGSPGNLVVNSAARGGEAVSTWYGDDAYITQADLTLPTADDKRVALLVRYIDPDNFMGAELRDNGDVNLIKMLDGKQSTVASNTYTPGSTVTVKIKCDGINYTVWVGGTQKISTTDGDIDYGTVGLWAERSGKFENIKAGYDNSAPADNDIDDAGDTLVINDTFTGTSKTFTYDKAGNLVEDDRHRYQYDAWNRMVKAERIAPDGSGGTDTTTLHTAEFDVLGRRIEKVVSNSGDQDGTYHYWYNGQQLIEMRDGSDNVLLQAYYGTQYIDEIVALKLQHGYCTVSQDANYNVVTLTDLASRVLERVFYTEYGQPIIESERYFGDYDGDGDLDSSDLGLADTGGACRGSSPSGACRVLDTDQDGDVDGTDYTTLSGLISAAPTTNRVHHARRTSPAGNLFLHQGLVFDAEIGAYQNREREYEPGFMRFLQPNANGYIDGLSLYEYIMSDPLNLLDPTGLDALDWLQGALDVAGLVPGIGEFCDLANAGISVCRGDYTGAALSACAAIPFGGWLATGGKAARRAGKVLPPPKVPTPPKPKPPTPGGGKPPGGGGAPTPPPKNPPKRPDPGPGKGDTWRCTTKARGDCPSHCAGMIYYGYGPNKKSAKSISEGACRSAGCEIHDDNYSCNCGHSTCHQIK